MSVLVSVIVPVYNVETHIAKCIESLLNQKYVNFEILLINDGSTDSSGTICNTYQAKNDKIKVFHLENGGVSSARNFGIEQSKGDFIQFVDSDDFVDEDYISSMVEAAEFNRADLVIGGIKQIKLISNELIIQKELVCKSNGYYKKVDLRFVMSELIDSSYINYCYSKLISSKVLKDNNIRFDKNISLGEDTLFVLNVIKHSSHVYVMSNAKYNYLLHSNDTLTYKFRSDKFSILNNLSNKLLDFCIQEGFYTDDVRITLDTRYLELIKFCIDENFISRDKISLYDRLTNMNNVLKHESVYQFMNKDKLLFKKYPSSLIKAIQSQNILRYSCVYYCLIISRKLRGIV